MILWRVLCLQRVLPSLYYSDLAQIALALVFKEKVLNVSDIEEMGSETSPFDPFVGWIPERHRISILFCASFSL